MSTLPSRQNLNHLTHKRFIVGILALLLNMLLLSVGSIFNPAYAVKAMSAPSWSTFHDPLYGFSLKYPGTWILTPESNGSHITLLNPITQTTVSPIVTTQAGTASTALTKALPVHSVQQQTRTVAGYPAIDYLLPYVATSQTHTNNTVDIGGPRQVRQVIVPVTNTSGTTNVYTFLLTQPTSTAGKISTAEQADLHTFDAILNSFTLPTKVTSTNVISAAAAGCDRTCWADHNWSYGYYDDSYSVSTGSAQPNFQCAEFVARAITQDGMVPGLNNGGVNGSFLASGQNSYGSYARNGKTYNLLNVGVTGIVGLHNYLTDSGLAINIGQNTSQAQPGDIVFFYDNGPGTDYTHTMIITSIGNGNIYMDGHNIAEYHTLLGDPYFTIYHLTSATSGGNNTVTPTYTFAGQNADGRPEVFARATDNTIWHNAVNIGGGSWSGWSKLQDGYQFNGDPTVGRNADGRLEVFARNLSNNIVHIWQSAPNGTWGTWQEMQSGMAFQGTPVAAQNADGRLEVFARGTDNMIWHNAVNIGGGSWSGWSKLQDGYQFNGDPTVGRNADGRLEVFARNLNNNIVHIWQGAPNGTWGTWQEMQSGMVFQGTPAAAQNADGRLEVFAWATDNTMWHNAVNIGGGSWSGWSKLQNGYQFNGNPAVGRNADGRLEVFARNLNNNIVHIWQSAPNGTWGTWQEMQGALAFQGTPGAVQNADGHLEVFSIYRDNSLWHNWVLNGNWSGWETLQPGYSFQQ